MENAGASAAGAGAELTCVRCGYDLRGRGLEEPCPECGLAGHRSVVRAGRELWDCPPGWVVRVAVGTVVVLVGYVLWPVMGVVAQFVVEDAHGLWGIWGL